MKLQMIQKSILLILILAAIVFLVQLPINAAGSFSASAGKTSMTVGEQTTFTATANSCGGRFTISTSDASVVSVSGETSQWIENRISFGYPCSK